MTNNPLQMLMSNFTRGVSPMSVIKQMAGADPRAAQVIKMLDGKNSTQIADMVTGIARNYGTTPDDIAQSIGLPRRNRAVKH